MKTAILTVSLILAAAGGSFCGDYIRLGVDSVSTWTWQADIPFFIERTCLMPELIQGTCNGFVLTATGDATWEFVSYEPDPIVYSWFILHVGFTDRFDGSSPDTFDFGGASMPPAGMPVFEEHPYFKLTMNIGSGEGEICIDSTSESFGCWYWYNLTCGLGGEPDRPLFVDKYYSDDEHPICITVYDGPSTESYDHIRIGVDSIAAGLIGAELPFYVSRTCPTPPCITGVSLGFEIISTGDASWSYSDYLPGPSVYDWFILFPGIFNNAIDGMPPDSFLFGAVEIPPNGLPVTTEKLLFSVYLDIGPGAGELCIDSAYVLPAGAWKFSGLVCGQGGAPDRPLFLAKDSSDANHPICITIYESVCGDLDLDGAVDIDDIVYLLQYVFGNEPMSIVLEKADVDCSGAVDIDDIVYLLNYVFVTGPEPCAGCP